MMNLKRWQQVFLVIVCLFTLYSIKSALGIDISSRYHAIDLVKVPAKFVIHRATQVVHKIGG